MKTRKDTFLFSLSLIRYWGRLSLKRKRKKEKDQAPSGRSQMRGGGVGEVSRDAAGRSFLERVGSAVTAGSALSSWRTATLSKSVSPRASCAYSFSDRVTFENIA